MPLEQFGADALATKCTGELTTAPFVGDVIVTPPFEFPCTVMFSPVFHVPPPMSHACTTRWCEPCPIDNEVFTVVPLVEYCSLLSTYTCMVVTGAFEGTDAWICTGELTTAFAAGVAIVTMIGVMFTLTLSV